MHRFFISEESIIEGKLTFGSGLSHRIRDVLRLQPGEHIIVLDNSGWQYEAVLITVSGEVAGEVLSKTLGDDEPQTEITLYQALLKGNNFETVLQKCTEIGVANFVPLICERCVAREPGGNRLTRWRRIVVEAAEQSRRGKLPCLKAVLPFRQACQSATELSILPWEGERTRSISSVLKDRFMNKSMKAVSIFVGPEGGFSKEEVEFAQRNGIIAVSLGKRILRAETAGLVSAAIVLYESGGMDGDL